MPRKPSDKLRDMDTPMVLGVELDRQTLTPVKRPIPAPAPPVVQSNGPVMVIDFPPDPAPESGLLRELMAISSGTLAAFAKKDAITGDVDSIQERLIYFYLRHYVPQWKRWIDVWMSFKTVELLRRRFPTAESRAALKLWLDTLPEPNETDNHE